jgi:hypothetical protein
MRGTAWFSRWFRTKAQLTAGTGVGKGDLTTRAHVAEGLAVGLVLPRKTVDRHWRFRGVAGLPPGRNAADAKKSSVF